MARKRCVLRWGAAVGLYWAACAAHVWRTGGLLALGLAWNMLLAQATDNQKLIQLLNNLREQMYRYRVEYLKREEAHPQLIAEHAAIIEYISKGEKKAATDIMCKHIDNQVTTVIDVIRTKQN